MAQLQDTNPYLIALSEMLHGIEEQIEMKEPDIVLILISLDTEEKIRLFSEWILTKMDGEKLKASRSEIIGAAVRIGTGDSNFLKKQAD